MGCTQRVWQNQRTTWKRPLDTKKCLRFGILGNHMTICQVCVCIYVPGSRFARPPPTQWYGPPRTTPASSYLLRTSTYYLLFPTTYIHTTYYLLLHATTYYQLLTTTYPHHPTPQGEGGLDDATITRVP